jgi:hypothetical protein
MASADPAVPVVPAPGSSTSEFKLTMLVLAIGAVLDGLSVTLEAVQSTHLVDPSVHWFNACLAVTGTLMMLVKALGYTRSRTLVKMAALAEPAAAGVAAQLPFLVAERDNLKEALAQLKGQPLPQPSPASPTPPSAK